MIRRLLPATCVGFPPVTVDENHPEPCGVGAFLLAGSEMLPHQPGPLCL